MAILSNCVTGAASVAVGSGLYCDDASRIEKFQEKIHHREKFFPVFNFGASGVKMTPFDPCRSKSDLSLGQSVCHQGSCWGEAQRLLGLSAAQQVLSCETQ